MNRAWGETAAREIALLHWVENAQPGELWSSDDARWATQLARASSAQSGNPDFQRERARFAARRLGERDERLAHFLRRPMWSARWPLRAALLGLLLGLGLERLGGAQMNLLALPLWGVLALQLLGYALLVALRGRSLPVGDWWARWLARGSGSEREVSLMGHWLRLSAGLQQARAALLWHAALLGISLGLVASLYGRALQKEYVIGWESTYLEAPQVQRLADAVLAPASRLSGITVPPVAPLRHGAGQAPRGPAGAWLHLLALTVLLVALPRAALAASSGLRAWRLGRALPLPAGPRDLRLAVIDPDNRLAGGLFGAAGERLASPEGDRLLVSRLQRPPGPPPKLRPWGSRGSGGQHFHRVLQAAELPPGDAGWPTQLKALRALELPERLQPAWSRLLSSWERDELALLEQAAAHMAEALLAMRSLRLEIAAPEAAPAAIQRALQPLLDGAEDQLRQLYGRPVRAHSPEAPDTALQLHLPLPRGKSALLGSVMGGALVGLKADLASGGLTLGGGTLTGALVGGLGAAGLSDWLNRKRDRRSAHVQLDAAALPLLARALLERWLALLPHAVEAMALEAAVAKDWTGAPQELPALIADAARQLVA